MNHQDVDSPQPGRKKHSTVDRSHLGRAEYADYFEVGHDFVAFYVDWGQQSVYEEEMTTVYSRIVTSPLGAVSLIGVLAKALCAYARTYGAFPDDKGRVVLNSKQIEEALCDYVKRFITKSEQTDDRRPIEFNLKT